MAKKIDPKFKKFGKSKKGNFEVVDSIGVPHPYCITPKHLEYADSMILDAESIKRAESKGAVCDICRKRHQKTGEKILSFDEHEQALVVDCHKDFKENQVELKKFLLSIKDRAVSDGYAGFAFHKAF